MAHNLEISLTCCRREQINMINDLLLFSDDDEEIIEYISTDFYDRRIAERTDYFNTHRDKEFHRRFRLEKHSVAFLLNKIKHRLQYVNPNISEALSPMNQLLCTLRYFATGSQLVTCGDFIGVHESTACRTIHKVTDAIARLYPEFIVMPRTEEELRQAAMKFYQIARFPRAIGAVDCTHVRTKSPGGETAEIYRNRKGYFSMNTQAICSADLLFTDVVARWHGSAHDSHIWDNSNQRRHFLQGTYGNYCLLGDSGYAQTPFMMTPLGNVTSPSQSLYNESQIRTRNVIERTFGIWKRRFPIVSRGIQVHLSRVPGIIIATCVLHNIARLQNDLEPPVDPEYPPILDNTSDEIAVVPNNRSGVNTAGQNARQVLIEQHFGRLA
ncbi:putative nuclease HARBI1 [Leguminivora glycinivorella]|uniref:putative nuclease HARBI1 n=1 Tax=Leguminivora glycinivorella TaxID=1035111 RepID=UPI00200C291A|nr:putative nuclease HARBI1 [Leguminivora glycinivorella]XP_047994526.1 putative nuclease HARBI1 [Leguminivora glycinivorella]